LRCSNADLLCKHPPGSYLDDAKSYIRGHKVSSSLRHFLFGPEVETYLSDAAGKWARLRGLESLIGEGEPRTPERAEELGGLRGWFANQADTGVKELFAPYLNFEKWR